MQEVLYPRSWNLTIIRAQGLQYLRPEKLPWRPIVSVVVDEHQCHELNLGCDGQNPNLRLPFTFHEVTGSSRVDISVFHRSQSKRKGKKRNLLATASFSLADLHKLQGSDPKFEARLSCTTRQQRGSSRGKAGTATLLAKLQLADPQSTSLRANSLDLVENRQDVFSDGDHSEAMDSASSTDTCPPSPTGMIDIPVHVGGPDNVRIRGYLSDSDDDRCTQDTEPLLQNFSKPEEYCPDTDVVGSSFTTSRSDSVMTWIAASLLPAYTERAVPPPPPSRLESVIDSFSPYRSLRDAVVDSDYERVLSKLQAEWYYIGASLVALAGLYAAVFGISSGSLFLVDGVAKRSIAVGSISSGIGIAIDAWFMLAYSGADSTKFQRLARDVYGTYLFFCISARLPALCMFISACALMMFLLSVAWSAWPTAVLVMCFVAGTVVSLQFIVYGLHCVVSCVFGMGRRLRAAVVWCFTSISRRPPEVSETSTQYR